eukprot:688705-Prymnesium_polylepis.3
MGTCAAYGGHEQHSVQTPILTDGSCCGTRLPQSCAQRTGQPRPCAQGWCPCKPLYEGRVHALAIVHDAVAAKLLLEAKLVVAAASGLLLLVLLAHDEVDAGLVGDFGDGTRHSDQGAHQHGHNALAQEVGESQLLEDE